jgi:hypothetical protein
MAPEQMRGQPVTIRTDIYAVGLLAYHMLTGQMAFGGAPGVVQSYLQIHGPRPKPSTKADLDPAIDAPIARALATNPADRFATVGEFIEALRAVIVPQPVASGPEHVVAVYVEGDPHALAAASNVTTGAGMMVALATPNSLIAIAKSGAVDVAALAVKLGKLHAKIAIGPTTAELCGNAIDGEALDVEAWSPYPLADGIWISPALQT